MAWSPAQQSADAELPYAHNSGDSRDTWRAAFKEVMTRGITPLWVTGVGAMTTVALIAAFLNNPIDMSTTTTGSAQAGGAAATSQAETPLQPEETNNQEGAAMQSQSSHTSTSVQSDNDGTTITVNGHTETIQPGQSVDRAMSYDQDGTHTEVHISAQSSGTASGVGSSNLNVNVQSQSTAEGGMQ